jgi:hypothetical protein
MSKREQQINPVLASLVSIGAECLYKTLSAPIVRIQAILQVQHSMPQIEVKYKNFVDLTSRIIKEEGFRSLWRGNSIAIFSVFYNLLIYPIHDLLHEIQRQRDERNPPERIIYRDFLMGGFAGIMMLTLGYPVELIRIRMAVDVGKERSITSVTNFAKRIAQLSGIHGFFKGIPQYFIGTFLYRSLYYNLYKNFTEHTKVESPYKKVVLA